MPGALRRFSSGSPLRIPAAQANAWTDAAIDLRRREGSGGANISREIPQPEFVQVKNATGSDQDRYAILGLDDILIDPDDNATAWRETIAFSGVAPTEEHRGRWAILLEPVAAGQIGRALIAGVTPGWVQVDDEGDTYADIDPDETGQLLSGSEGAAQILWKPTGTGRLRAYLRIGLPSAGGLRIGILDEPLAAPASITGVLPTAAVSRHTLNASTGQLEDSGTTDTVSNPFPSLTGSTGAAVGYELFEGIWVPVWVDCSGANEVQTITITGSPDGGTFTLAYQGQTTSGIAYNASAATVQTALEGLSSIGSGNVVCTGGDLPGTAIDVEFQGSLAETNVDLLMADGSSLTGGTSPAVAVTVDTEGCCG